jgi:hypothetical protein
MHPRRVLVDSLARHEERIIVQPIAVILAKRDEKATVSLGTALQKSPSGCAKQTLFEVDYAVVFDVLLRERRCIGQIVSGQKTLLKKSSQIDEKRVAGECRKALIRGIAVSRRAQWQYLPDFLS